MFSYSFTENEQERARNQAEYQVDDHEEYDDPQERRDLIEAKQIGNLGEIAFNEFCRLFIPPELWEWNHREALEERAGQVAEYDSHDFDIFGRDIDVKTSQDPYGIRGDLKWWRDVHTKSEYPDIYVLAISRLKHDHVIVTGWVRSSDVSYREITSTNLNADWLKRSRKIPSGRANYIPTNTLHDLLQLGPPEMQMFRPE